MSRLWLVVGLAVSLAVHAAALLWPTPAPDASASDAEVVEVVALPRPPEPLEAVVEEPVPPMATPPASGLDLARTAPPPAVEAAPARGDFAGRADAAAPAPRLRIDWGGPAEAQRVLDAGDMRLVILRPGDTGPSFAAELVAGASGWSVRPFTQPLGRRYANRLRIVDGVPAFADAAAAARSSLRPGDRLAVVVPVEIERMVDAVQRSAIAQSGRAAAQVREVAGRFVIASGRLQFQVQQLVTREEGA